MIAVVLDEASLVWTLTISHAKLPAIFPLSSGLFDTSSRFHYHGTHCVHIHSGKSTMQDLHQQEYLHAVKTALSKTIPEITWDAIADLCGIAPRALKTYRMPKTSKDYRAMPKLVKAAIDRVVEQHSGKAAEVLDVVRSAYHT